MALGKMGRVFGDIEDLFDRAIESEVNPKLLEHLKQETLRRVEAVLDEQIGLLQRFNQLDAANTDKASRLASLRDVLAEVIEELSRHRSCTSCSNLRNKIGRYAKTADP